MRSVRKRGGEKRKPTVLLDLMEGKYFSISLKYLFLNHDYMCALFILQLCDSNNGLDSSIS